MSLTPGTRLGPYEISALIGAGGMGEVYLATDTNLKRSVAVKVLPDSVARDGERLARFQREAEVLASLNHPNIAAIHGLERTDDMTALVMELVEGPTLADRIAHGPLPVDEALPIARQIAEALEAAHEQGIIHRDLKPANIKLRPDGQVKILDFGLAKAFTTESVGPSSAALTNSPTLTSPIVMTGVGIILGTAAYMAPEQAKGKAVDRRADIWAFGVVTCEMLIGRPLYDGETAQDTLARIIEREPDVASLPAATPPFIRDLLRRCLTKDPRARLQAIGEARIALEQAIAHPRAGHTVSGGVPTSIRSRALSVVPWVTSAVLAAGLLVVLTWAKPWQPAPRTATMQVRAELGADVSIVTTVGAPGASLALSPDGSLLVFVGQTRTATQLYSRRLAELIASPIPGTDGARDPFFSHDGRSIAFFADGKLKWLDLAGGPASAIADASNDRGGAWGDDGNIVYMPVVNGPLMRVSAARGGTAEAITKLVGGEVTHRWPQILPGARAIVYTAHSAPNSLDTANIVVQPLPTGNPKIVHRGGYHARVLPCGHLVFIQDGALFAAPFDADRLAVTGRPVRIVEGIAANSGTGGAQYAVSTTGGLGRLVYLSGEAAGISQPITWVDRKGVRSLLRSAPSEWRNPSFSPDGRRLAVDIDNLADISLIDLARDAVTKLTFNPEVDQKPVWTPSGSRIVYSTVYRSKSLNLHWIRADGSSAEPERLAESDNVQFAGSWHPRGRILAFTEIRAETSSSDLMTLEIEGDESAGWKIGQPKVFLGTTSNESEPMFSPDGNWIAYQSNQGSGNDVYVRPYPGPGPVTPISTDGGLMPVWSRTRPELLYRTNANRVMVVTYSTDGRSFQPDKPQPWSDPPVLVLQRPGQRSFDLHPDGNRIAGAFVSEAEWTNVDTVVIIENFFDELKRLVPTK